MGEVMDKLLCEFSFVDNVDETSPSIHGICIL